MSSSSQGQVRHVAVPGMPNAESLDVQFFTRDGKQLYPQVLDLAQHGHVLDLSATPSWVYDSTFSVNIWGNR